MLAINFYKHHIGDYAKKTAHLSIQEHGAYLLMLHTYYGTERPLPKGETLYRIVRAVTKPERAAVDSIARQFWTETETGYVNGRAFEEMESATHLGEVARQNGNRGGRPKRTQSVSENNPVGLVTEPGGKAIQTPDSRLHSEKAKEAASGQPPPKPKRTKPALSPLPEDFVLTPELEAYAEERLPDVDCTELIESFRGKARAKGWVYANWRQAFQEFIRNCAPNSGHFAAGQYPKKRTTERKWD